VGNSINSATVDNNMAKIFIYYLNRFIDLRNYWPELLWRTWRFFSFIYIFPLLKLKHGTSWDDLWLLRKALVEDSTNLDKVDRNTFNHALKYKFGKTIK
jgi:hypothetical protein